MKYISKYNENKSRSLELTWVDFTAGMDGAYALYINDDLYKYGDSYHNKIQDWYRGFKNGLNYSNITFTIKNIIVQTGNEWIIRVSEYGESPPKHLSNLDWD